MRTQLWEIRISRRNTQSASRATLDEIRPGRRSLHSASGSSRDDIGLSQCAIRTTQCETPKERAALWNGIPVTQRIFFIACGAWICVIQRSGVWYFFRKKRAVRPFYRRTSLLGSSPRRRSSGSRPGKPGLCCFDVLFDKWTVGVIYAGARSTIAKQA